ncbi:MAG: hypothetical protein MI922_04760 [Bacteroidales bacterium]|nr:hypothetical protein [Bacteroidales bacterium]
MITKIDYEKSLHTRKLVYETSRIEWVFDRVVYSIIVIAMFPLAATFYAIFAYNEGAVNDSVVSTVLFIPVALGLAILFLYRVLTVYNLDKIVGISPGVNRTIVESLVSDWEWIIYESNDKYLITAPLASPFAWGHQVTILFDDKDILINSISFGRGAMTSYFHRLGDVTRRKDLVNEFNLQVNHSLVKGQ